MKKKIVSILICTLLIATSIVIIPTDPIVKAVGCEESEPVNGLDYEYLWSQIYNVSNVIHTSYEEGDIPKGRFMGSIGGNDACDNIIISEMDKMNLDNVRTEKLGEIDNNKIYYNRLLDIIDYNLTVNSTEYEFSTDIPKSEVFPSPGLVWPALPFTYDKTTYFNDVKIKHQNFRIKPMEVINGWFDSEYIVTEFNTQNNEYNEFLGKLEIITEQDPDPDPEDQLGKVYLLDWDGDTQNIINNLTYASGVVLIEISGRTTLNLSNNPYQVKDVSQPVGENITDILANNSDAVIMTNQENLTIYYEIDSILFPELDYVVIDRIPNHTELAEDTYSSLLNWYARNDPFPNLVHYLGCVGWNWSLFFLALNIIPFIGDCKGLILYSSFDHHLMIPSSGYWDERSVPEEDQYMANYRPSGTILPRFYINETLGEFLNETWDDDPPTTIIGDIHQDFYAGTGSDPGVDAYNAIGELNIDESPEDMYYIISNRYDGMWGETPGDSGIGTAIVLGLARHQKNLQQNYSIDPKYNITYLFTTGEEIGFRGAYYHRDNLSVEEKGKIKMWIGFDQLGMNQSDLVLAPECQSPDSEENATLNRDIVWAIANLTNYENLSGYDFEPSVSSGQGGAEDVVWGEEICDTIVFVKDNARAWDRWHATGNDYDNGDSLNYTDPVDVNLTYEIAWHFVKYFLYDPDCWFETYEITSIDTDDGDDLVDSVKTNFTVESILPDDLVIVEAVIMEDENVVNKETMEFIVNSSGYNGSITVTLPESEPPGYYNYTINLYNFSGRINEKLGLEGDNYNDSKTSNNIFLYPYGYPGVVPEITNVSAAPNPVGYGLNVTISADVTSNVSNITNVTVRIFDSDLNFYNLTMSNSVGDTYEYVFNYTWTNGQYTYQIWAKDENGNQSTSPQHVFNVGAEATIDVCTIKDSYGDDEFVNLTDPPVGNGGSSLGVGYELLDDGSVLHIWNKYDSYYFNTSSGIQLTNHYDEYWSHNVLMLGYYNNDEWNLIYRTDELSGFNKDIDTDNETFVNATIWKDLTYNGYNFRLAIRYHLGVDDNEITVIPYIKNLGDAIPYSLGFGWEINDIQISMTPQDDYIEINGSSYYLNTTIDETYKNMVQPYYYIREDKPDGHSESLYLRWNENLDDVVRVKSRTGQYNAPVSLFIRIGTLSVDQEKYTELYWYDADQVTYYFDGYYNREAWPSNPGYMVDGNENNYASTTSSLVELCNNNTCNGTYLGQISNVELRVKGYYTDNSVDIILRPVYNGIDDGDDYEFDAPLGSGQWSEWFEISSSSGSAEEQWTWSNVSNLDCDVEADFGIGTFTLYCSKVEVRVTYISNYAPAISNPYPTVGSTGIKISPLLNITVSDADGDTMNITWLSNSSGSGWVEFGTANISVGNGTYHQTFSNASVNGGWWYWKVNVSDGNDSTESSVFYFYTGNESKIVNSGSTDFSGYLLMTVDFYNETLEEWCVDAVVVNDTTPRIINSSEQLGLDTIFNPENVNTSSFSNGDGTYRVYVAFRDPDGDVLVCDDESLLEAWYEFEVDTS